MLWQVVLNTTDRTLRDRAHASASRFPGCVLLFGNFFYAILFKLSKKPVEEGIVIPQIVLGGQIETKKTRQPIFYVVLVRPVVTWSLQKPGLCHMITVQYAEKLVHTAEQIHADLTEEAWMPRLNEVFWNPSPDWSELEGLVDAAIVLRSTEVRQVSTDKWLRSIVFGKPLPDKTERFTREEEEYILKQSIKRRGERSSLLGKALRSVRDTLTWQNILGGEAI